MTAAAATPAHLTEHLYRAIVVVAIALPWAFGSTGGSALQVTGSGLAPEIQLAPGALADWEFRVRNATDRALDVSIASKSCSCVSLSMDDGPLEAGAERLIVARSRAPHHGDVKGWFILRSAGTSGGAQLRRVAFGGRVRSLVGLAVAPREIVVRRADAMDGLVTTRIDVCYGAPDGDGESGRAIREVRIHPARVGYRLSSDLEEAVDQGRGCGAIELTIPVDLLDARLDVELTVAAGEPSLGNFSILCID